MMTCDDAAKGLADMPDEIVLAIARALGRASDIVRLGSTCSYYSRLLRDESLWKLLCLTWFGPPLHQGFLDTDKGWRWLYKAQGCNASTIGIDVGALMTSGRIYWGDTLDGVPHGYGLSLALPTRHRNGRALTRRLHDSDIDNAVPRHDGYWVGGRACGYGVRVYRNGSRYRGMWRNDLHHGYGERADAQKWIYVGEWHNGHPHGDGPCGDPDGASFRFCSIHYAEPDLHDFFAGLDHGNDDTATRPSTHPTTSGAQTTLLWNRAEQTVAARQSAPAGGGTLILPGGVVYRRARDGDFIRGTVTWPDGRRFEGYWSSWRIGRQQLSAIGVMTHPDGRAQEGTFWDGRLYGSVRVTYPDGTRVKTTWYAGQPSDSAVVLWPDGRRYVGSWRDDACNGHGEMTWPDGSRWAGTWIGGQPEIGSEIVPAATTRVAATTQ